MKTNLETFGAAQNVNRFITNGMIPFLYKLDCSGLGTPASSQHIVRIIDTKTGEEIVATLSTQEATIIAKASDPLSYLMRWLTVFRDKVKPTKGVVTLKKPIPGVLHRPIFDDTYFVVGRAYRIKFNQIDPACEIPKKYNETEHDAIVCGFDTYHHVMKVMIYEPQMDIGQCVTITVEQYIKREIMISPLTQCD